MESFKQNKELLSVDKGDLIVTMRDVLLQKARENNGVECTVPTSEIICIRLESILTIRAFFF